MAHKKIKVILNTEFIDESSAFLNAVN
jgi:hypothetical protein